MPSIFTKIVNGEIPSYKIYEDEWGTWLSAFAPLEDDTGKVQEGNAKADSNIPPKSSSNQSMKFKS